VESVNLDWCGGCRAQAYASFGHYKAPDPGCINNEKAFLPSLGRGIGKPMPTQFRPDLIFEEGRSICCGTMSPSLGVKMLFTPFSLPVWNWFGLLVAIVGMILIIPIRGIVRMLMMRARLMEDK